MCSCGRARMRVCLCVCMIAQAPLPLDPLAPTWTPLAHARRVRSPCVLSSANCASSLASAVQPGRRPSPMDREMS